MEKQFKANKNVKQMLLDEVKAGEGEGPGVVLQVPDQSYIKEEFEEVLVGLEEKQLCVKEEIYTECFPVSTTSIKSEDNAETQLSSQLHEEKKNDDCTTSRSNHQMTGAIGEKDFRRAESIWNPNLNTHLEICDSSETEFCEDDEDDDGKVNHPNFGLKKTDTDDDNEWESGASESKENPVSKSFISSDFDVKQMLLDEVKAGEGEGPGVVLQVPEQSYIKEEFEEVLVGLEEKQLCVKEEIYTECFPVSTTSIKSEDNAETQLSSQLHEDQKDDDCTTSRSNHQMTGAIGEKDFRRAESIWNPNLNTRFEICDSSETEVSEDDEEYRNVNHPNNFELKISNIDDDNEWESGASESKGNPISKSFISSDFGKHFVIRHSLKRHMAQHPITGCSSCLVNKKCFQKTVDSTTPKTSSACDECGKYKKQITNLSKHKTIHTENPFCCDLCGHSFSQKTALDKHRRIHTGEKPFCCDLCGYSFRLKSDLDKHRRIHTGEKPFCCDLCGYSFSQKSSLNRHMRIHTEEKSFCCDLCGYSFSDTSHLEKHMKKHQRIHTGEKPFCCDLCGHSFSHESNLDKHMKIHTGKKPFCCDLCGYSFRRKPDLDKHKRIHTGEKPFCCELCGYSFSQKSSLNRHMRIHTEEKPFCCDLCGYSFSDKSRLDKHMQMHTGEKPFCCDLCGHSFSQNSDLDKHKRIHTGENIFCCSFCGHSFSQKSTLDKHMRIHPGEKPFCCDLCGQSFSQKSTLAKHMRIHPGEKPFGCNLCGQSFSQKSTLESHRRIHTGEKPFCCELCGYSFSQKSSLNRHMRIHTEEKPFSCDLCGHSFSRESDLYRHKRIHTGENPFYCNLCRQSFSQKSALDIHKRIHTGEKPS